MHTSIKSNFVIPAVIIAATFGFYFATSNVADAQVRTNGIAANRIASSTASTTRPRQVDATCMSTAVEAREVAIMTTWTDLTTTLTTALTDRTDDLIAAWALSDAKERNTALKTTWADWKKVKKEAQTEFKNDRKAAWDTFKATVKSSCKVTLPKEEALEKTAKDSIVL
jgi:hypothetical protein